MQYATAHPENIKYCTKNQVNFWNSEICTNLTDLNCSCFEPLGPQTYRKTLQIQKKIVLSTWCCISVMQADLTAGDCPQNKEGNANSWGSECALICGCWLILHFDTTLCRDGPMKPKKKNHWFRKKSVVFVVVLTKSTPGSAGGQKELIARGKVGKKKSPS